MNQKDKLTENTMLALQGKLVEGKKENEEFIKQCEESGKFDDDQMRQIRRGFEDGLTLKKVKIYADPKYEWGQMMELEMALAAGRTMEQIKLSADPKFDYSQMWAIQEGFEGRFGRAILSVEQVKFYADPKFDNAQMGEIRRGFQDGLTLEQIKIYADPKYNDDQMEQIREGFKNRINIEKIKFYADPKFTAEQMEQIREWFGDGLTIEQIKNKLNKKAKLSNKNTTGKYKYEIVYYLNTATRDRRPTTRDDFEDDWVEETQSFDSDLDAYEYVYTTVYDLDEDDLEDLYIEENVADDDVEGKINAIIGKFEDSNSDPGYGDPLVISIQGHNKNYNSGFDKESFEQEIEDDEDYED